LDRVEFVLVGGYEDNRVVGHYVHCDWDFLLLEQFDALHQTAEFVVEDVDSVRETCDREYVVVYREF
jgi:hypothetical protein